MVIGTAPSMDGYASNSSSMIQNRIKVTLYNACPAAILCDTDILKNAPMRMLQTGLGDMLAKYVSICEWRISHIVTGEYYCENVAALVRKSLNKCVSAAQGLRDRDPKAIEAVTEGLVLSGIAMSFAEISRPASGLEHYFSHLWEMMALDRGTAYELHGIQVGVGTYLTLRLYEHIRTLKPSRQKAEAFIKAFDNSAWEKEMREIFGAAADAVIAGEHAKYHKNDPGRHKARLENILSHWEEIQAIISQELPPASDIERLMRGLQMPVTPADMGVSREDTYKAFIGSRDIRDKYLTSSLLWDLGLLHEMKLAE
jgi:glycerol-1-phosphate dehydrogenase [NAD(P)+]